MTREVTDAGRMLWPGGWTGAVLRNAQLTPAKPALIFEGESLSYAALARLVDDVAHWMAAHLAKGDRFACYSMNHPEYFVLLLGAARAGVNMVPLNWRLSAAELAYQLRGLCAKKCLSMGLNLPLASTRRPGRIRQ